MDYDGGSGQAARYGRDLDLSMVASHELKEPLALIRQLALESRGNLTDVELTERLLTQIELTAERGLRLTTDLTRAESLEGFIAEPINPVQICEDVAHELTPLFKAHNLAIEVPLRRRKMTAVGNRTLLKQVLINLADNALHYASADTPVRLSSVSKESGKLIRISVRDYGPSVPANTLQRLESESPSLFLPTRPQSSGLGLYIARRFAEAMHGRLGLHRHHDGVTFYIELPVSTQLTLL